MAVGRRELLRLGALVGGVGAAAFAGSRRWLEARAGRAESPARLPIDCGSGAAGAGDYGSIFSPPDYLDARSRDALHAPPPPAPRAAASRSISLTAVETNLEVARGCNVTAWTYGGRVPGPILRATAGDELIVEFKNRTSFTHNIHFHGSHDVMQDGIGRVTRGSSARFTIEAGPPGLHPYHCHVPPYAQHISRGLYGALIVDPPEGRPAAHEFVLCLGGFDIDADGRNDIYAWNGIAGWYERYPLKVPAGELVRLYILNMVENDAIATFHLHAQTFDLYRSGSGLVPSEHTDVVSLGPAERAIVEFRLPRRGRYMFHPHQSHMTERGAMGWIVAI